MSGMYRTRKLCYASILILLFIIWIAHLINEYRFPPHIRDFRFQDAEERTRVAFRQSVREAADLASNKSWLYIVTPTDASPFNIPELTRLSQTLCLLPRVHWVLSLTDGKSSSSEAHEIQASKRSYSHSVEVPEVLTHLLEYSALPYTILKCSPKERGKIECLSETLEWVRKNVRGTRNEVVAIFQESTTVDFRLLDQIRNTQTVSSWPLGLLDENDTIIDPEDWPNLNSLRDGREKCSPDLKVDMESVAVSLNHLQKTGAHLNSSSACPEASFLRALTREQPLQVIRPASKVAAYAWKTRPSKIRKSKVYNIRSKKFDGTNLAKLKRQILEK